MLPSFGMGDSEHGRDYRPGYGMAVAEGGAMNFYFGVYANRRESLSQAGAEHGVQGQLTARWQASGPTAAVVNKTTAAASAGKSHE